MPSGTLFYTNVGVRHLQSELWVSSLGKGICPGFQDYCVPGGTLKEAYSVIFCHLGLIWKHFSHHIFLYLYI